MKNVNMRFVSQFGAGTRSTASVISGRDAFHRVRFFASQVADAVERVPTQNFFSYQLRTRWNASLPGSWKGAVSHSRRIRAAVLLEVVVALVLFVGAAAIVAGALNASLRSVERLRLNAHASNLAVSIFSELQIGLKTPAVAGPQKFEAPFEEWTWEILADPSTTSPDAGSEYRRIEVVIRHDEPAIVHRLCQVVRVGEFKEEAGRSAMPAVQPSRNGQMILRQISGRSPLSARYDL